MQSRKLRFVIEGVHMRWPTVHEHEDHAFDSRWKMASTWRALFFDGSTARRAQIVCQQICKGQST